MTPEDFKNEIKVIEKTHENKSNLNINSNFSYNITDQKTINAAIKRKKDLKDKIEEARVDNSKNVVEKEESINHFLKEIIKIDDFLNTSTYKGKPKTKLDSKKKIDAVDKAINRAISEIADENKELWKHFNTCLDHKGKTITYNPDLDRIIF